MASKLVIAPHVDDDVLGCGGILDADTVTIYLGVDRMHLVSEQERHREACAVIERTGGRFIWPLHRDAASHAYIMSIEKADQHVRGEYYTGLAEVNYYDGVLLVPILERALNSLRPDEVYLPWPSYNQDHRATYEAALVALRPHDENHFVPRVFVYEGSQINYWDWAHPGEPFHPNYFVPIDIDEKIARYECMASQVRGMRSPDMLRALATLRGGESGVSAAEAFMVLRWVGER